MAYPLGGFGGGAGYGGYGSYGGGMNGGVGLAPVQIGQYAGTPLSPYENTRGELYSVKESKNGLAWGVGGGALGGAALGAAAGSVVPGVGTVIGGAAGAAIGGLIGGLLGDKLGSVNAKLKDADDNGRVDGTPLGSNGYQGVF